MPFEVEFPSPFSFSDDRVKYEFYLIELADYSNEIVALRYDWIESSVTNGLASRLLQNSYIEVPGHWNKGFIFEEIIISENNQAPFPLMINTHQVALQNFHVIKNFSRELGDIGKRALIIKL